MRDIESFGRSVVSELWDGSVFMMLPRRGANLVMLEGASLRRLDYDRDQFALTQVTNENRLKVGKGLHEEVAARLKPALGGRHG